MVEVGTGVASGTGADVGVSVGIGVFVKVGMGVSVGSGVYVAVLAGIGVLVEVGVGVFSGADTVGAGATVFVGVGMLVDVAVGAWLGVWGGSLSQAVSNAEDAIAAMAKMSRSLNSVIRVRFMPTFGSGLGLRQPILLRLCLEEMGVWEWYLKGYRL